LKKIFHLRQENKKQERVIDSIKHEIRKYLKRERNKKLPEEAVFWDFDCRFGQNSDEAAALPASGIISALDKAKEAGWERCYVEIIARASYKLKAEAGEEEES
jgi:hypothetical protein